MIDLCFQNISMLFMSHTLMNSCYEPNIVQALYIRKSIEFYHSPVSKVSSSPRDWWANWESQQFKLIGSGDREGPLSSQNCLSPNFPLTTHQRLSKNRDFFWPSRTLIKMLTAHSLEEHNTNCARSRGSASIRPESIIEEWEAKNAHMWNYGYTISFLFLVMFVQ